MVLFQFSSWVCLLLLFSSSNTSISILGLAYSYGRILCVFFFLGWPSFPLCAVRNNMRITFMLPFRIGASGNYLLTQTDHQPQQSLRCSHLHSKSTIMITISEEFITIQSEIIYMSDTQIHCRKKPEPPAANALPCSIYTCVANSNPPLGLPCHGNVQVYTRRASHRRVVRM